MIREYMNREIPTQYAYMLTGTYGQKILMNRDPDTSDYPGKYCFGVPEFINGKSQTRTLFDFHRTTGMHSVTKTHHRVQLTPGHMLKLMKTTRINRMVNT